MEPIKNFFELVSLVIKTAFIKEVFPYTIWFLVTAILMVLNLSH